jgi:uncharacterized protein DUF4340
VETTVRKSTVFVVLLAALLGGAVWYFEFKREKPAEDASKDAKPIFAFPQEEISEITITREGITTALEKRGSMWRMKQPVESATDSGAVEGVLSSISFGRVSKTIAIKPPGSSDALRSYGLDAPGVTLDIKLKSGATHKLWLGAKDFSGSSVYALVDNAPDVALLPADVLSNADKPALDFRDRHITVFEDEKLVRVKLQNEHGSIAAAKNAEGKWLAEEPAKAKGKEVDAERILNALREAQATAILDLPTPADRAKLAHPAVVVEFAAKAGTLIKVEFSGGKGDAYARSSAGAMLFQVARAVVDGLNFKPEEIVKMEETKAKEIPKSEDPAKQSPAKKKN